MASFARCAFVLLALAASPALAANVAYHNLVGDPFAAYGELNSDQPIYGDVLVLNEPGILQTLGLTIYNPEYDQNDGVILSGNMIVTFYDNTVPYTGGAIANPVLGTASLSYDYTSIGGLPAGYYDVQSFDLSSLNINLPQNIIITQQFFMTAGDSLFNGVVVYGPPIIGASSNGVFIQSAATPADYYGFIEYQIPANMGYYLTVTPAGAPGEPQPVPLPASAAGILALTGGLGLARLRRKLARD